jgi:hypothetical protein
LWSRSLVRLKVLSESKKILKTGVMKALYYLKKIKLYLEFRHNFEFRHKHLNSDIRPEIRQKVTILERRG